ncbi:MAG: hypothetical protein ACLFVW_03820 [Phycisphaerae bacterium]
MLRKVVGELRHHVPFTVFGTVLGVGLMLVVVLGNVPEHISHWLFYSFHPLHVFFSAVATAGMYTLHGRKNLLLVLVIGYVGAIGIATLSDSLIPYAGEWLLGLHADPHGGHAHAHEGAHIGFIEMWWLVNAMAVAGVLVGYYRPRTELPHAMHVLLSMAASTFHVVMALKGQIDVVTALVMSAFLFIAVWLPCCTSDIVFPLLLTGKVDHHHGKHSRDEKDESTEGHSE